MLFLMHNYPAVWVYQWPIFWRTWGFTVRSGWHTTCCHTHIWLAQFLRLQSAYMSAVLLCPISLSSASDIRLNCSGLLGSAQVFAVDTKKTFLFLLRGNVLLYPQEECCQGIWCTLQKCRTLHQNRLLTLKWAHIFRNRNCFFALCLLYFPPLPSLTFLYPRARQRYLHCWRD